MPAKKKVVKKKVVKKKAVAKKAVAKKAVAPTKEMKPLPKKPGALVDAMHKQRVVISALNKQVEEAKKELTRMEDYAFLLFKEDELEGARGKLAQATITHSTVPTVEDPADWEKVFKYITKKKDFAILQKRLAVTHIRDLWDDKIQVPGIVPFKKTSLSVTKVKAK